MTGKGAIRLCTATPDAPHPAETRTGRCRFHQDEYRAAMKHYHVLLARHRKGEGPDPGEKDAWEASIAYTPLAERFTMVSQADRHTLRALAMADSAAMSRLRVLLTEEGIYDTAPADIIAMVRDALAAHAATLEAVDQVSEEPD